MASKSTFVLSAQRSFWLIRHFQHGRNSVQWNSGATKLFRGNARGFATSTGRFTLSSRKYQATAGTAAIGSTLGVMGFFKKEEKEELSEHDKVRRIVSAGIVAKQSKDFKDSSVQFHKALDLSTDFYHQDLITEKEHLNHRVFIYDQMANLSLEVQNFKQAEELFIETMKLALQLGMRENDNAMIEMAMKVATIQMYTGRPELAYQGFNFCISEQEKKLKLEDIAENKELILDPNRNNSIETNTKVLLGKAYQRYSHTFMQKRDFKNALTYSEKALDIAKECLGPTDETTLVLINDLATCQIMVQNYDAAEKLLTSGIRTSRRLDSVMESAMSSNLGALYIRTKRLDEAESTCKRGLKVAKKHYDSFMMGPCQMCLKKLAECRGELPPEDDEDEVEKK